MTQIVWIAVLGISAFAAAPAEKVLFGMPPGYKQIGVKSDNGTVITTYRPETATDSTWTEIMRVTTLPGQKNVTAAQAAAATAKDYSNRCARATIGKITTGQARGYPTASVLLKCEFNPRTNLPEASFTRIVRGNDALYLVQRIFNTPLTAQDETAIWNSMREVSACDMRIRERACPELVGAAAPGDTISSEELTAYRKEVTGAVTRNIASFDGCYKDASRSNPQLHGRMDLHWTVDIGGSAKNVEINDKTSTLADPTFRSCVINELNRMAFPPNRFNQPIDVMNFPLIFHPRKN